MWAKDESTGEIALKPIAQTFERVAPSALALTFSNGETIETTVEHPFYVQDKGFTPAGLVALGNSIVTRAGPSLEVTAIEKHESPHRVYNFEVEDFHTYFVGQSALWTHNMDCRELWDNSTNYGRQFSHLGKSQRPTVVTTMEVELKNGQKVVFNGRNKAELSDADWDAMLNQQIKDLYGNVPSTSRNPKGHGNCAEMMALSSFLGAGHNLNDIKKVRNFATQVAGADSKLHGKPWAACGSCQSALSTFGLTDVGKIVKEAGVGRSQLG